MSPETISASLLARSQFGATDVWRLLVARAAQSAERSFLVWQPFDQPSVTYTYGQIEREARSLAAGLQRRGVRVGDRILIHLDNCPEFIIALFACAAAGATAVTTNTRSAQDELAYYAHDADVVGAITQPRLAALVRPAAPSLKWLACVPHDAGVPADVATGDPFSSLYDDPGKLRESAPDLMRAFSVQYTSGTTARPKGVVWTHANGLWAARVNALNEDLRASDCHYTYLPLFHTNAISFSLLPTLWAAGRMVLTPKWSTSRFWRHSIEHDCTWLSLIGLSLRALVSLPPPPAHRYRMFGTGLCANAFPRLNVKTIGWWGMTETVAPGIVGDALRPNRDGAIGRAASQYSIAVLREDRTPVEPEETGQIHIRGVPGLSLFAGYLGRPEETANAYDEQGWFRTGDLVTPHADGYFTFVDRSKDMLRVGAENVAASEIERVILSVSGVAEVAVVGRPDDKLDEVPVAFVVPAGIPDSGFEARISESCRRLLADFKVPRNVFVVRELPRSTISKVDKVELRAAALPSADRAAAEVRWLAAAKTDPSGDEG